MRAIALIAAVLLASACAPRDAEVRRARLEAERRSLDASLDELQARLLVSQARVRFWREMRERHESVSAIACASQDAHAEAMAQHAPPERTRDVRQPTPSRRHTRIAALPADAADATDDEPASAPR